MTEKLYDTIVRNAQLLVKVRVNIQPIPVNTTAWIYLPCWCRYQRHVCLFQKYSCVNLHSFLVPLSATCGSIMEDLHLSWRSSLIDLYNFPNP